MIGQFPGIHVYLTGYFIEIFVRRQAVAYLQSFFGNERSRDGNLIRHSLIHISGNDAGQDIAYENRDKRITHIKRFLILGRYSSDVFSYLWRTCHLTQREDKDGDQGKEHVLRKQRKRHAD